MNALNVILISLILAVLGILDPALFHKIPHNKKKLRKWALVPLGGIVGFILYKKEVPND